MASIKEIKTTDVNIVLDKVKRYYSIYVASVTLDGDVTCLHCGKNLKSGKVGKKSEGKKAKHLAQLEPTTSWLRVFCINHETRFTY